MALPAPRLFMFLIMMATATIFFVTISMRTMEQEGLAYMTLLSGTMVNMSDTHPDTDYYFIATRLLGYQLLHQSETHTRHNIPLVVLVTYDVAQSKRDQLVRDGCTIIEVQYVDLPEWVTDKIGMPQWKDVMTKLRAWQMDMYTRILFLDSDIILNHRLDGIFGDTASHFSRTRQNMIDEDIPAEYLFATIPEAKPNHSYPPTIHDFKDSNYFNAGFFLLGPSSTLFDYYTSFLLGPPNVFDPQYPEQNLLNFAHRQDGAMPWQEIDMKWNIRAPDPRDWEAGVVSVHDKWWRARNAEMQPYYDGLKRRMDEFYGTIEGSG